MKDPPHAAFVVVQHLSPDFKSFMVEPLTKHTNSAHPEGSSYL